MTVIKLALVAAALGAAAHPTPKVVLVKHADFLRQSLAGATQYFVRTVSIGKEDLAAIRKSSDFTPADPDVQFYLGQTASRLAPPCSSRSTPPTARSRWG